MTDADTLQAVRRKLNVTWDSDETDARLSQVVETVSPALAHRLSWPRSHAFSPDDGEAWALFLNACLYEFSDALDDFWANYAQDVRAARAVTETGVADDGTQAQG